jgi:hypothetical protein
MFCQGGGHGAAVMRGEFERLGFISTLLGFALLVDLSTLLGSRPPRRRARVSQQSASRL